MKKYILSLVLLSFLVGPVLAEEAKPAEATGTPAKTEAVAPVKTEKRVKKAGVKKEGVKKEASIKKAKSKTKKVQ